MPRSKHSKAPASAVRPWRSRAGAVRRASNCPAGARWVCTSRVMSGPERSSTDSTVSKCRGLYCLLALLAGVLARQPAALAQPCTLAGLHWMAGTWLNSQDTSGAQERWVVAPGEVLMGSAWEFPKGHAGYAEVMAIRQDGDGISMFLRHFD